MVGLTVSLLAKREQFLKHLGDEHKIDLNTVVSELHERAFSDSEGKELALFSSCRESEQV